TAETAGNTRRVRLPSGGQRRHDHRADVLVHLVGRDHYAGTRLADLGAAGGVEVDQMNLETLHHSHSSSSKRVGAASASCAASGSASSPAAAISANADDQPWRARAAASMTMVRPTTFISISSPKPACSSNGLGMRTPWELPIR